jgi:hypothetical protein
MQQTYSCKPPRGVDNCLKVLRQALRSLIYR